MKNKPFHDHICHCGTSSVNDGHETASHGCVRRIVESPISKIQPDGSQWWLVGNDLITDFTLRQQRGYWQHPCGCWSTHGDSNNSLEGEW